MQAANRLQRALRKGGPAFGAWQMLPGSNHSRAIARSGVDWICVDTEHGNVDDAAMHEAVAAIAGCGISPVVRVAADESWMVKRALDSGAHGIVVPLINSATDAQNLVRAAKFPPEGTRGFGSPFPMGAFTSPSPFLPTHSSSSPGPPQPPTSAEYLQQANASLVTIIQIETRGALADVDAIAALPGVDVLLVGPFDLGNNIGHPILDGSATSSWHPELQAAVNRIHSAATAAGKGTGIYCTSGRQAREFADKGFHMISVAADMIAIPAFFAAALSAARGDAASSSTSNSTAGTEMDGVKGPYGR